MLRVLAAWLFMALPMSAHAESFVEFSGIVNSAYATSLLPTFTGPQPQLIGDPFSAVLQTSGGVGIFTLDISLPGLFVAATPLSNEGEISYVGLAPSPGSTFQFIGTYPFSLLVNYGGPNSFSIVADIDVVGFHHADNSAGLQLTLGPSISAVPGPPALPMFASALLALGVVSYIIRRRAPTSCAVT